MTQTVEDFIADFERRLLFSQQMVDSFGPNVDITLGSLRYWIGKVDAYTIVLETLRGER